MYALRLKPVRFSMTHADRQMSAFWWYNPSQPHPIPQAWGDSRNFQWRSSAEKYWCKLCRKYADDKHIISKMHTLRKMYPNTYLWYLGEHRQPPQENMLPVPPPPPGPPPDYLRENLPISTSRIRGYEVGMPAPPADPPRALDAASDRSLEGQLSNGSVELLFSPYPDDTKTTRHIVQNETLSHSLKNYVSNDPDSVVSNRWHRYAVDAARAAYWWWSPVHHDICFREDAPGDWCNYSDPATGKTYWYLSDEIWFWEDTGSTMC